MLVYLFLGFYHAIHTSRTLKLLLCLECTYIPLALGTLAYQSG